MSWTFWCVVDYTGKPIDGLDIEQPAVFWGEGEAREWCSDVNVRNPELETRTSARRRSS